MMNDDNQGKSAPTSLRTGDDAHLIKESSSDVREILESDSGSPPVQHPVKQPR
jgi:hypothetical protein